MAKDTSGFITTICEYIILSTNDVYTMNVSHHNTFPSIGIWK